MFLLGIGGVLERAHWALGGDPTIYMKKELLGFPKEYHREHKKLMKAVGLS